MQTGHFSEVGVRHPRERTEVVRVDGGGDRDFTPVVVKRTITVSLDCSP